MVTVRRGGRFEYAYQNAGKAGNGRVEGRKEWRRTEWRRLSEELSGTGQRNDLVEFEGRRWRDASPEIRAARGVGEEAWGNKIPRTFGCRWV